MRPQLGKDVGHPPLGKTRRTRRRRRRIRITGKIRRIRKIRIVMHRRWRAEKSKHPSASSVFIFIHISKEGRMKVKKEE